MRKPAVAAVGAGYWGKNIIRALHKLGALSCICDSSDKALAVQRGHTRACARRRITRRSWTTPR